MKINKEFKVIDIGHQGYSIDRAITELEIAVSDSIFSGDVKAIKIIHGAHRPSTSEIKMMFKILRTDDASEFDDLGYRFFNTTGVDDNQTAASADENDFREYIYTAGVTDDGIGEPLDEFIGFQIKIVMQGTNCAEPPRIKDLRAIALVT